MKKAYLSLLKKEKEPDKIKGGCMQLGNIIALMRLCQRCSLQEAGGIVNRPDIITAAKIIVSYKYPALLNEHGGLLSLDRSWAESFFRRL